MVDINQELFKHIRRIQIETGRLAEDILAGLYHSAFKGRGVEFEEVREYFPGDDVRAIDWNVTARMQHPYVKSFHEERQLTVMLMVDISASSRYGSGQKLKSEVIAEIGALLSFTAIKNNDKIGLILFSDRIELYVPAKNGLRHILRVIRELLAFEPKGRGSDLNAALVFLGRLPRRPSVCFLISDFICDEDPHQLATSAKRCDLISICVTDPTEVQLPDMGLVPMVDLETGKECIVDTSSTVFQNAFTESEEERIQAVRSLMKKVGAGFIQIETNQSYVDPIRKFFKLRRVRH